MPPTVRSKSVSAPAPGVFRVAHGTDPFTLWPPRSTTDLGKPLLDGNRWDDPAGRYATMYCATNAQGAFGETIARYRECEGLLARIAEFLSEDPDTEHDPELQPGKVPDDYFADRYLGHGLVLPSAEFVDVEHPDTHAACAHALLRTLIEFAPLETIDRGTMHSPDRRVTQTISTHFHALAQTPDHTNLRGIRYESRIHAEWECWVMWEPSPVQPDPTVRKVTRDHPDLLAAATLLRVKI